jgi:hypothetical protein
MLVEIVFTKALMISRNALYEYDVTGRETEVRRRISNALLSFPYFNQYGEGR